MTGFAPKVITREVPAEGCANDNADDTQRNARDSLRLLSAFARIHSREERLRVVALAEEIAGDEHLRYDCEIIY